MHLSTTLGAQFVQKAVAKVPCGAKGVNRRLSCDGDDDTVLGREGTAQHGPKRVILNNYRGLPAWVLILLGTHHPFFLCDFSLLELECLSWVCLSIAFGKLDLLGFIQSQQVRNLPQG